MRWLPIVVLLGCGSGEPNTHVDASALGPESQPFEATFGTPVGAFDAHFLHAGVLGGTCDPPFWQLAFAKTPLFDEPTLSLSVAMPASTGGEVTGTLPGAVRFGTHATQNATFEAVRIDYPGTAPRITGRFVVGDPAWAIDLQIDVLGTAAGCI